MILRTICNKGIDSGHPPSGTALNKRLPPAGHRRQRWAGTDELLNRARTNEHCGPFAILWIYRLEPSIKRWLALLLQSRALPAQPRILLVH